MRTLSADIRLLGDTLGEVLRAHGGARLLEAVEAMRLAAKKAREGRGAADRKKARKTLGELCESLDAATALDVTRAFTLYFQLVNLAEDVHRSRQLSLRERECGGVGVAGSLPTVVAELCASGATRAQVLESLEELRITLVFTAHPTEARRRTTERLLYMARQTLHERDRRSLTPSEERRQDRRLRAAIEALWQHASERRQRPDVLDEVRAGLWYAERVLLDNVPRVQRRLRFGLEAAYGEPVDPTLLPMVIRFGSWMGSDRDGNPFVTDAVTERALELGRQIALERYESDLAALVDPLAVAESRIQIGAELQRVLDRAARAVPEVLPEIQRRNPDEPLRRLLSLLRERIARTQRSQSGGYGSHEDFLEDLVVLRRAVQSTGAVALPDDALLELIERVRCFGFVLAALDVREDSRVHRRVIAELLDDPSYLELDDDARIARLTGLRWPERSRPLSDEARRLLDLFETIKRLQGRFGQAAIGTYIVSRTESHADLIEILRLAELAGLEGALDLVPLLESGSALERAAPLLQGMLDHAGYRAHLQRRGDLQEVLVGYSDSMKETGILASRVLIIEAQRRVRAVADRAGLRLRIFHGRGGSVSRGGGPTHQALRAIPHDAFCGRMKITVQGESRAAFFADPELATRHLEQTLGAALVMQVETQHELGPRPKQHKKLLDRAAASSRAAYRELVESDELWPFYREATPSEIIQTLHIGSRPSKRPVGAPGLDDVRAIPWVFAWSQSRSVLTGWYGVGTALCDEAELPEGVAKLRAAYDDAPFFRDLLSNVQMALAKADLGISERYASLCRDEAVRKAALRRLRQEYERTRSLVLEIIGQAELLDNEPVIKRSIRLRNPYVDPLSYLQIEAMRRLRAAEATGGAPDAWSEVARLAVQGISAGLRNTG